MQMKMLKIKLKLDGHGVKISEIGYILIQHKFSTMYFAWLINQYIILT